MLEDIKKEIFYEFEQCDVDISTYDWPKIDQCVIKILDKYKDIDKYKNAWEELKTYYFNDDYYSALELNLICKIDELEQKYNIRKEDLDER